MLPCLSCFNETARAKPFEGFPYFETHSTLPKAHDCGKRAQRKRLGMVGEMVTVKNAWFMRPPVLPFAGFSGVGILGMASEKKQVFEVVF